MHFNNIFVVLLLLGKWCRVERFDVPEEYVQVLLADMPNAFLNSTREREDTYAPPYGKTLPKSCTIEPMKSGT